ncbi:type II toxin-antitoxin system PemK/MazF family toxin [Faecalibacterium prausnitzii]|uniref:type II toxin-antitoxin system PemK/MazF family toxin n=1 Tax=Faecalibacterium prausnitzii TaxID=853 RepID=UPI003F1BFEFB
MPIDSGNLALKGLDDLFSTEEKRQEEQREQVQQIPIDELHPFTNHPFKVLDDEAMTRTVESIAQYGVLAPLIARPRPDGDGYEIISGHRRQYAAKLAGLDTLPVIVRQMSDDAAVILMVDSNLQREHILPSERAFAYKMKLDAIKNQGARSDLTSTQVAQKLSVEKVGDDAGVSNIPKDWKYLRGDIYYADMEPHIGSEQGGTRPVVVLQNDVGNRYAPTLIVATVTSRTEKKRYQPTHVLIAHNTAFEKPSVVQLEQIFTIDKSRIQRFLGRLTQDEMQEIEKGVVSSLALAEITS